MEIESIKNFFNKIKISLTFALISLILFIQNSKLIKNDTLISYDDWQIVYPLYGIRSIKDYIEGIKTGAILDLQPLRDLSYKLDFFIKDFIPFYSYHLTNVFLWFAICFIFFNLLINLSAKSSQKNINLILSITLLFAFSPVSISSIAWISARKHLLTTFFILLSTYEITKLETNNELTGYSKLKIFVFYTLSLISQPINLVWPIWAIIYLYSKKSIQQTKDLTLGLFSSMTIIGVINFYYFKYYYFKLGFLKFVNISMIDAIKLLFLSLGRYFIIFLNPLKALPTPHDSHSIYNFIGPLLLIIFSFFIFYYKKNRLKNILWYLYFFAPLLLVSYKTNVFNSDTYTLNSFVGLFILVYFLFESVNWTALLFVFLAFYFAYFNQEYIKVFESGNQIWVYSYVHEPTIQSTINVSRDLISDHKYQKAYELSTPKPNSPYVKDLLLVHAETIYFNKNILLDDKIHELQTMNLDHSLRHLLLALLYLEKGDKIYFEGHLFRTLEFSNYYNFWTGKELKISVLVSILCQKTKLADKCLLQNLDFYRGRPFFKVNEYSNLYNMLKQVKDEDLYRKAIYGL
jgi:hypothetical protein